MPKCSALLLGLICTASFSGLAHAQYKWLDANGRVGYGDMPPSANVTILQSPAGRPRPAASALSQEDPASELPYELRQAVDRSPVVLYSAPDCEPCDLARDHLKKRGVPFVEKTVSSARDVTAFRQLGFPVSAGIPVITAGSLQQIGYHGVRWDDLFDRAGYPRQSMLPSTYRSAAAESLAADSQEAVVQASGQDEPRGNVLSKARNSPYGKAAEQASIRF